jgi:hypothetical protein
VSPAPAPTPPAQVATFQPGHYVGRTSQNESFAFDISSDGTQLMNLVTGQINQSCQPIRLNLYGGNLNWGGYVQRVSGDGSFAIDSTWTARMTGSLRQAASRLAGVCPAESLREPSLGRTTTAIAGLLSLAARACRRGRLLGRARETASNATRSDAPP